METPQKNRTVSKLKTGIVSSVIFILLGIYLVSNYANDKTDINPTIVKGVGVLLIVLFLFVIMLSVKKLNNLKGK